MTEDFRHFPPPEHWDRFVRLVQTRAPTAPITVMSARERALATAGAVTTVVSAGADGAGAGAPPMVGVITGIATSSDADAVIDSLIDAGISEGAAHVLGGEAGPLVGGLIMLVRGTHQALDRTDQMVTYLLGMSGFTNTLARCAIAALREPTPYLRMPMPQVPSWVERTGDLYSGTRREWFIAGYDRARDVVREVDTVHPTSGDHYSKRCFTHLGMQSNMTGHDARDDWRLRQAVERYLMRTVLGIDLEHQREVLRRWAGAA